MRKSDEILSGEQARRILHVSKRKAAWLFEHGYVKCTVSDKKTWRYSILRSDLDEYIRESAAHPERFRTPPGEFTSKKRASADGDDLPHELPESFRPWLERRWTRYHVVLTLDEAALLTGYSRKTMRRWTANGTIPALNIPNKTVIVKAQLVDFLCTRGYAIGNMSVKHRRMMGRFFKGMEN